MSKPSYTVCMEVTVTVEPENGKAMTTEQIKDAAMQAVDQNCSTELDCGWVRLYAEVSEDNCEILEGEDTAPCMVCGQTVSTVPDGVPMCDRCASKEG